MSSAEMNFSDEVFSHWQSACAAVKLRQGREGWLCISPPFHSLKTFSTVLIPVCMGGCDGPWLVLQESMAFVD